MSYDLDRGSLRCILIQLADLRFLAVYLQTASTVVNPAVGTVYDASHRSYRRWCQECCTIVWYRLCVKVALKNVRRQETRTCPAFSRSDARSPLLGPVTWASPAKGKAPCVFVLQLLVKVVFCEHKLPKFGDPQSSITPLPYCPIAGSSTHSS